MGKTANYSWPEVSSKLKFDKDFEKFWENFCNKKSYINFNNFLETLITDYNLDNQASIPDKNCVKLLQEFSSPLVPSVLRSFSVEECIEGSSKPKWHYDLNGFYFDANIFYKDIKIQANIGENIGPDIRTLWEKNRFNNIFFLGINNSPDKFFSDIKDWIDKNPYLYGPNWVCPMEVGIRSVNWVLGFMFFKDIKFGEPKQKFEFWEKFICSLYDHMIFIEQNWEIYDTRTNNHYLSDLLGYYYLLIFFDSLGAKNLKSKIIWVKKEFLKELDKQILPDGSSYEGSTAYHNLICEIVYYFKILSDQEELKNNYNKLLDQKFKNMCQFASYFYLQDPKVKIPKQLTPLVPSVLRSSKSEVECIEGWRGQNFVTIGDNDSGKIVAGLPEKFFKVTKFDNLPEIAHFKDFGVSVYKSPNIHITLRHHAYNKLQPSAHFHNDFLSITLAINNIPVIIDPGSYVYTASSYWRNYFRSAESHNGFYIKNLEPVKLDNYNLFAPDIPEKILENNSLKNNNGIKKSIVSSHELYKNLGLRAARKIELENLNKNIIVTDSWDSIWENINKTNLENLENLTTVWSLILHPDIKAIKRTDKSWDLFYNNIKLANISSKDLDFEADSSWASFVYGEKIAATRLAAQSSLKLKNYGWQITIF